MGVGACALTGINTMKKLTKIGVQLYTVREDMKKDFEGTLAKVASIGYQEVEFAGYYNRTPKQVRDLLDSNRLSAPASHIPLETLRKDIAGSIEAVLILETYERGANRLEAVREEFIRDLNDIISIANWCEKEGATRLTLEVNW